ncbi:MAG: hypothetical protein JNK26_02820 [Candidatus Doudnabacteria bacterium]|nr:hypothetical protein [Candidatus Doudnabacteria bacterium]
MNTRIYEVIINLLLFYFVTSVINGVTIREGNLLSTIIVGIVFGVLMAAVPQMLGFFKINVNTWASLLLSIMLSFIFLFILSTLGIAVFAAAVIDLGLPGLVIAINDAISSLLFLSVLIALLSVGLKQLGKK